MNLMAVTSSDSVLRSQGAFTEEKPSFWGSNRPARAPNPNASALPDDPRPHSLEVQPPRSPKQLAKKSMACHARHALGHAIRDHCPEDLSLRDTPTAASACHGTMTSLTPSNAGTQRRS